MNHKEGGGGLTPWNTKKHELQEVWKFSIEILEHWGQQFWNEICFTNSYGNLNYQIR